MAKFKITVQTVIMEYRTVTVDAENADKAQDIALDEADMLATQNAAADDYAMVGGVVHHVEAV